MVSYIQINDLTKSFGDLLLFEKLTLNISQGEKVGLIAPNGSGKTTLLNIIAGKENYDSGELTFRNDLRIGYLEQSPIYPTHLSVLQACFYSENETVRLISAYEQAMENNDVEALQDLLIKMEAANAWDYERKAKSILGKLNIMDYNQSISELSGGQLKRIALANVLITEPDFLILDEPTNHLDLKMTEWLEDFLSHTNVTILMITHDRYFLERVCNQIVEIEQKHLYKYKGSYNFYLQKREERHLAENAEMDRAQNLFRKELDWMRRQPQARASKAKYRKDAFYELEEKTKGQRAQGNVSLGVKSSYIGKKIFEAKHVTKSFGDLKITEDFNYVFSRYEKMGIVGYNGTGKSTFIKMLLGLEPYDSGVFDIGETVQFGYYSQEGIQFDEQLKVIDVARDIAEYVDLGNGERMNVSHFLTYFLFEPSRQNDFVYKLSGGERRRLYLCTVLMRNPNFLVLDEPTNDLDIITLNVLEEYLKDFKGCVIVVSHDRYFMDKVVDHLMVFKGQGEIQNFPGSYSDYREWKEKIELAEREASAEKEAEEKGVATAKRYRKEESKKRLTYKEQKEYDVLEIEIFKLEEEQKTLESELSSGTLSNEDLLFKSQRVSEIITSLNEKTNRWLELSEWV